MSTHRFRGITLLKKLLLVSIFILSFSCIAFAGSEYEYSVPADENSSVIRILAPDLDQQKMLALAEQLADRAVTYDTTDIYNLLNSFKYTYSNTNYVRVYDNYIYGQVNTILSRINDLSGYNSAYDTHSLILDIWRASGGNTTGNQLDLLRSLKSSLDSIVGSETWSVADSAYDIKNNTSYISSIYNYLATMNSTIGAGNANLSNIDYYVQNISSTTSDISDTTDSISNNVSEINDKLNIDWITSSSTLYEVTKGNPSAGPSDNAIVGDTSNKFIGWIYISSDLYSNQPLLLRIKLPFQRYAVNTIDTELYKLSNIYYANNQMEVGSLYSVIDVPEYYIEYTNSGIYLYIWTLSPVYNKYYGFEITSSELMTFYNTSFNCTYLKPDTLSYHQYMNSILSARNQQIISQFKELYASDDLLKAKAEQQEYEDEVIEDFTGNGAAASTSSDKNGLKSVTGNVKSGLNTGGSIGNALGIFDSSNSLWQFFTTTTQNNVNPNNRNSDSLTRSISNSESDDVIDFLTERDADYFRRLGNE